MLEELSKKVDLKMRGPVRSWRAPGVKGISAIAPKFDPAFDVAGLPSPFSVYFPAFITNLYSATIYVTALLISPPAGWTDSEQNIVTLGPGSVARVEKSNATRATPSTPSNETITVRWNYRTGSYAGPIIGFDDFTFTIYWEDITTGTIVSTEDFESPQNPNPPYDYDGWVKTNVVGTPTWGRATSPVVHGAYSLYISRYGVGDECYIQKTVDLASGTRGYLFGYVNTLNAGMTRISFVSPVETLEVVYIASLVWRRWGVRLTPAASNMVRIWTRFYWGADQVYFDYFRWVRF